MNKNNFIMFENETGLIRQIASFPTLISTELFEEDGTTVIRVDFYNDVTACYYADGVFYEDAELTMEISDPANYIKPHVEPEPVEPVERYTLDEASEIIAQEVASDEV